MGGQIDDRSEGMQKLRTAYYSGTWTARLLPEKGDGDGRHCDAIIEENEPTYSPLGRFRRKLFGDQIGLSSPTDTEEKPQ